VDTGTRLRVAGEGEPGPNGGPAGDLYVVLEVKEHPFFERRGADLYCTIPLSIAQATSRTGLQVPGLNGEESLKIPRRHSERRRLSHQGRDSRSARRRQRRFVLSRARADSHE